MGNEKVVSKVTFNAKALHIEAVGRWLEENSVEPNFSGDGDDATVSVHNNDGIIEVLKQNNVPYDDDIDESSDQNSLSPSPRM